MAIVKIVEPHFPKWFRISLFLALVVFFILDLIYDDQMLLKSAHLSLKIQQKTGKAFKVLGQISSTLLTFWSIPLVGWIMIFPKDSLTNSLYYMTLFGVPQLPVLIGKALFYKGRPFAVLRGVSGKTCDPGMPSGHTAIAVTGYYMLYLMLIQPDKQGNMPSKTKRSILGVVLFILASCVMLSRITLGDHSYNQIIMAFLMSTTVISNMSFLGYLKFLRYLGTKSANRHQVQQLPLSPSSPRSPPHTLPLILCVSFLIFILLMTYLNEAYRSSPSLWIEDIVRERCPGGFIRGESESVPFSLLFIGVFLFLPFFSESSLSDCPSLWKSSQRPSRNTNPSSNNLSPPSSPLPSPNTSPTPSTTPSPPSPFYLPSISLFLSLSLCLSLPLLGLFLLLLSSLSPSLTQASLLALLSSALFLAASAILVNLFPYLERRWVLAHKKGPQNQTSQVVSRKNLLARKKVVVLQEVEESIKSIQSSLLDETRQADADCEDGEEEPRLNQPEEVTDQKIDGTQLKDQFEA